MAQIKANGIMLEYETRGDESNPTVVLIRGLGTQLTAWPETYLQAFVDGGYHVVIFDNRDVGKSEKFGDHGQPDMKAVAAAVKEGKEPPVAYKVSDMAADVAGLLDALGIEKAHIVGMSLGGMIVQYTSVLFPDRLLSSTQIMSSLGTPGLPTPTEEVSRALVEVYDGDDLEGLIAFNVRGSKLFTGRGRPMPDELVEAGQRTAITRCYYPEGVSRQYAAVVASGLNRVELARQIAVPYLVVHGTEDPLILVEHGVDTAEKVAGAKLHLVEGMGHDLPPSCMEEVTSVILAHMKDND